MEALFASGHIADVALAVMALEAVALWALTARRGDGGFYRSLLANLAAGAFLVLAVRLALTDANWQWIAGALLLSLLAHGADLSLRLRASR